MRASDAAWICVTCLQQGTGRLLDHTVVKEGTEPFTQEKSLVRT
jgi:catabolite regulation protein CreA